MAHGCATMSLEHNMPVMAQADHVPIVHFGQPGQQQILIRFTIHHMDGLCAPIELSFNLCHRPVLPNKRCYSRSFDILAPLAERPGWTSPGRFC